MQKYVLSELDSGERVISEKVPSVRSVAIGFWIGAGSRDERDDRAGVSHFIEHLLFKGSRSYDAQEIAETFDAMGAELNAATSREHTMVYSRVPDRHVDTADRGDDGHGVRADLRRARPGARRRARGDRHVRGLAGGARARPVLGGRVRPARARTAGDRHRRRDLVRQPARRRRLPPVDVHGRQHRRLGCGEHHAREARLAAAAGGAGQPMPRGAGRTSGGRSSARRRRGCASSARTRSSTTSASAPPGSRGRTGGGSPRRCSTRSSAAPRRRGCSRRSARSGGWRTPSTASRRSTPTRG